MDALPAHDSTLLSTLRACLKAQGLDGFLVPHADAHQSEYLPAADERLARLTGFTGSAGFAIALLDTAAVFVDGRYTLQAANEVDQGTFEIHHSAQTSPRDWLKTQIQSGHKIGYDAWLHTDAQVQAYRQLCQDAGAELVAVDVNPIDAAWPDQPAAPATPIEILDEAYVGLSSTAKRELVAKDLAAQGVATAVLGAGDSVAWLFNIRATDVPYTPLVLAFALLHQDGGAELFLDPARVNDDLTRHLGTAVQVRASEALGARLDELGAAKSVVLVPSGTSAWIAQRLKAAGAHVRTGEDPCQKPKATKPPKEIENMKRAHVRDGAALVRFLAWLEANAPGAGITELSVAQKLDGLRAENDLFRGLSFPTISGAGPNGAIVHYRVTANTSRPLNAGDLYLVDSGAQYLDGTTDVTRTVAIGKPTAEMKDRFTRVLKGHIAITTQRFPQGTCGGELDVLARRALWEVGLDYDHGTGHGVGTYLGVHEGPQRISKRSPGAELKPGMVLSNEPGYYKEGAYGIRIENLICVTALPRPQGGERDMLGFEPLTLAPIDLNLIEPALLTEAETRWLDAYHTRVRDALTPLIDDETRDWLKRATRPVNTSINTES